MANLATKYVGLDLRNPVMVSSSGLTDSVDKIKKLFDNDAGAVVLKSLFEEQINIEAGRMVADSDYPEAQDYIQNYTKSNAVGKYLDLISGAKNAVDIPIIASINCMSASEWTDFAKDVQDAGADALELNIYNIPTSRHFDAEAIENTYFEIVEKVLSVTSIPLVVKLGPNFSNLLFIVDQLYFRGVKGVVVFNRFYAPDIDVENKKLKAAEVFSSPADIRLPLRWTGILSAEIDTIDIAASTGVHSGDDALKLLYAGATVVQVCSTIYKNGPEQVHRIVKYIDKWLDQKGHNTINEIRGKLNYQSIPDPSMYERSQFMKYFSSIQ